jgi:hypothetical protein
LAFVPYAKFSLTTSAMQTSLHMWIKSGFARLKREKQYYLRKRSVWQI